MPVPHKKQSGQSQASWALLTEGVTAARLESHRLRHLVTRALRLIESSEAKEHLYEVAGDMIQEAPKRMEALERQLDRTAYALSVMGSDHLRDRLPLADRKMVDDATEKAKPLFGPMVDRVAQRYADLQPPLGHPGGPCHVVRRIVNEVSQPRLQEALVEDVESGKDLSNPAAAKVYSLETERMPEGASRYKRMLIGPHAQYRMDLRGITVPQIRVVLRDFFKAYAAEKSRNSALARRWEEDMARSVSITWTDKKLNLTIAFAVERDAVKLLTTYWQGETTPRPPGGGCRI
jgi:hypothetical protein